MFQPRAALATAALAILLLPDAAATDPVSPDKYSVKFVTDIKAGDSTFTVDVTRALAPVGADRFYALVRDGFYNNSAFFRVVPDFVVQFGISGSQAENTKWLHSNIKDDPVKGSNIAGTVTYAMSSAPNSRSTQLFINFKDNSGLDAQGFAPFGQLSSKDDLDVATAAFNPTPGDSGGVDQDKYEENGNDWIRKTYPGVNFILTAAIVA